MVDKMHSIVQFYSKQKQCSNSSVAAHLFSVFKLKVTIIDNNKVIWNDMVKGFCGSDKPPDNAAESAAPLSLHNFIVL